MSRHPTRPSGPRSVGAHRGDDGPLRFVEDDVERWIKVRDA